MAPHMGSAPPPPAHREEDTVHDRLIAAIRHTHPEWVQDDGDCPACREYGARLAQNFREEAHPEGFDELDE